MYKLADLVDYPDGRLDHLFVRPLGPQLWAVSKIRDGACTSEWQTVVSPEVLRGIGVDLTHLIAAREAFRSRVVRRRTPLSSTSGRNRPLGPRG
ncbi:hypothetical protein [Allosphingosinicella deserti]|uniref:Uncharacterized protein n=1 Tax=Allosphingosinicella deserti TaxID=2116704 RepID=A0A2P7QYE4_9SPHN|nr:hypothetical protein [Sphingomonas deserti]PSJ42991.1 hypothetical protein C7I55_00850 [Sphingomonas deserti]